MDDEMSNSSSSPDMLTPRSSTLSSTPQPTLDLRPMAGTTDLRTLESARDSVAWLSGQMVWAIERVLQARLAGLRPRADDIWVINEAGKLLARVAPHMEGTSGAFSLDGGRLSHAPYQGWPRYLPTGGSDGSDQSRAARLSMQEFSFAVTRQLDSTKREQRQRLQSSHNKDFIEEMLRSLMLNTQPQWHPPLVVNGSTPYPTTTGAETPASTGGAQAPEQQHHLHQQTESQFTHTGLSPRTTVPPPPTTTVAASPSSTCASPLHSMTYRPPQIQVPANTPTPRGPLFSRWAPLPLPPMSSSRSSTWTLPELRPQPQSSPQPDVQAPSEQHPTAAILSASAYRPLSPSLRQSWGDKIPELVHPFAERDEPDFAYNPSDNPWGMRMPYRPPPPRPYEPDTLPPFSSAHNAW